MHGYHAYPGYQGFDKSTLPKSGEFDQKDCLGNRNLPIFKSLPGVDCNGEWTFAIGWDIIKPVRRLSNSYYVIHI